MVLSPQRPGDETSATVTPWPRRAPGERPVTVHDGGALSTALAAWP